MHSTQSHVGIAKKVNKKKQQQQSYNVAGKVHVITWKPFGPSRSENFTNMYTYKDTFFSSRLFCYWYVHVCLVSYLHAPSSSSNELISTVIKHHA